MVVEIIALVGLAAEIGVLVLVYIDHEFQRKKKNGSVGSICRSIAHHAGSRHGLRSYETNRSTNGRGNGFSYAVMSGRHPSHLRVCFGASIKT